MIISYFIYTDLISSLLDSRLVDPRSALSHVVYTNLRIKRLKLSDSQLLTQQIAKPTSESRRMKKHRLRSSVLVSTDLRQCFSYRPILLQQSGIPLLVRCGQVFAKVNVKILHTQSESLVDRMYQC